MTTNKLNVIGYFQETSNQDLEQDNVLNFIVVFENGKVDGSMTWLEGYNVKDGHFEIHDTEWLYESCKRISLEEYEQATKGYFTYPEYLL